MTYLTNIAIYAFNTFYNFYMSEAFNELFIKHYIDYNYSWIFKRYVMDNHCVEIYFYKNIVFTENSQKNIFSIPMVKSNNSTIYKYFNICQKNIKTGIFICSIS